VGSGIFLTTSAIGFGSSTTPGNLLVCSAFMSIANLTTNGLTADLTLSTGAFVWTNNTSPGINYHTGVTNVGTFGYQLLCFIQDAPSMSIGSTLIGGLTSVGGSISALAIEFSLYEFGGIATVGAFEHAKQVINNTGTPSTPTCAGLTTSATDLIIQAVAGFPGTNVAAGVGYTLGTSGSVVPIEGCQYCLTAAPGVYSPAFGGTYSFWASSAFSFKGATAAASAHTYSFPTLII
jgi:hypothetical protein